jgi:hypothetical protein
MTKLAFQDYYPDEFSHCFGCGTQNPKGLKLKSFWNGDTTIAHFTPPSYYTGGVPDNIYGGLIASLLDCHGTATAAAACYRAEGRAMGTTPILRFVTASLTVNYKKPTPIHCELEIRGKVTELTDKKALIELSLSAKGVICATGAMVAVKWRRR